MKIMVGLLSFLAFASLSFADPGSLKAHEEGVWKIKFSPEGHHFLTAGGEGKVKVWWTDCFCPLTEFKHDKDYQVYDADYLPKERIVSTSLDGTVYVWNSETGEKLHQITEHTENASHVRAARDGQRFHVAASDGYVRAFDSKTYEQLSTIKTKSPVGIVALTIEKWLTVGLEGVQIWDVPAQKAEHTFTESPYYFAMEPITENLILVGGNPAQGGDLQILDVAQKKIVKTFDRLPGFYWQLAVSPGGEWVGASRFKGPVHIWERETGKLIYSSEKVAPETISLAFFPEGRAVLIGGADGVVRTARF